MDRYKTLGKLSVVTYPKSYEKYGEITGGFDDIELEKHIEKYGHADLLESLAYMQWRVWQTVRELNAKRDNTNVASN